MTLDEAIKAHKEGAQLTWNGKPTIYAEECQQLSEWLKELKAHREAWMKVEEEIEKYIDTHGNMASAKTALYIVDKYRPKEGENDN